MSQRNVEVMIDELDRIEQFILDERDPDSTAVAEPVITIESGYSTMQCQLMIQRKQFDVSCSGEIVAPYVQLVSRLPSAPRPHFVSRKSRTTRPSAVSPEQVKQAKIIFEELLRQGVEKKDAVVMMGPLASEVARCEASLSFREGELYDPRFGLTNDGEPFML